MKAKKRYERISDTVNTEDYYLFTEQLRENHGELFEADVTFQLCKIYDSEGPGLKLHGIPVIAIVSLVAEKLRAFGNADIQIVIDGDSIDHLERATRAAVFDHELEHIELCYDKLGDVVTDACDRPKCTLKAHDFDFGWFRAVVERHGPAAIEAMQAGRFFDAHATEFLPGMAITSQSTIPFPEQSTPRRKTKP